MLFIGVTLNWAGVATLLMLSNVAFLWYSPEVAPILPSWMGSIDHIIIAVGIYQLAYFIAQLSVMWKKRSVDNRP